MPIATASNVRRQLEANAPDPLYLLIGEDEVEKLALAHEFDALVEDGLQAFNVERISAADVASGEKLAAVVRSVIMAARTLPMMSPRRVVFVLQADGLLTPKRESDAATRALDSLEELISDPEKQTTLVFVADVVDRRSRMFKLLSKHATVVACGVLESSADAERWVRNRVAAAGVTIDPAGAGLLAERCGTDIRRLRNDIERLLLYTLGQKTITVEDVRQIVGAAALQNDWAMANAIEAGDARAALRELALTFDAGAPPEKILGQLGWVVRNRFPAARLQASVDAMFRTDLDLKSSAGHPRILLERLVVELCEKPKSAVRAR
jgi:DNA polymerase-3 subunit delta